MIFKKYRVNVLTNVLTKKLYYHLKNTKSIFVDLLRIEKQSFIFLNLLKTKKL